ncbi:hypothetical protein AVEN_107498-1 [Araneus ventricosus]|uniref:Uncharacterized protein n=1 Tax=Araneus ventricosus TaxID=182803 RepID=A0A4Y2JPU8_ARAVE|nr:hypothetical protein AVEN_107498-1 [Araneus ventricosus]
MDESSAIVLELWFPQNPHNIEKDNRDLLRYTYVRTKTVSPPIYVEYNELDRVLVHLYSRYTDSQENFIGEKVETGDKNIVTTQIRFSVKITVGKPATMKKIAKNKRHLSTLATNIANIFITLFDSGKYHFGFTHCRFGGRGGLVVRSLLWGQRVPSSRPDSTEDPPCMGPVAR